MDRIAGSITEIEATYRARTKRSRALMERAARSMPGGNTRTTSFHPPYPVVFERGKGPWLRDVDGHRYVDLFNNGLSLIHGHSYPPIRQAMARALDIGTAWSGASRAQIEFAELLKRRIPGGQLVRFANTGSEAAMLAVKLARRFTRRRLVLKFERAYHGSYPDLEAGLYGQGEMADRAVLARFNDLESCKQVFARHGASIAAVVYEPVMFTGRVVTPAEQFLTGLQNLARRYGALTILDDCLMLRLAKGGSTEKFGLNPDLVVLGKFIGGGTPVGAVVGRESIMDIFNPLKPGAMFHGGSFNGNVFGCSAGLVTLKCLTASVINKMDRQVETLRSRLRNKAASLRLDIDVTGMGSFGGIAFAADPVRHEDDPSAIGLSALFLLACLNTGVALGPGGLFAFSTVIDEHALKHAIAGMERALEDVAAIRHATHHREND
jgi:glutamate-1-semialdehyde 2,1-aminomutase